jgi:hypothetical protein
MPLKTTSAHRKDITTGLAGMQHHHFATVATVIRGLQGSMSPGDVELVAEHFADKLRHTNPKFDRARFLAACKAEA